MEKVQHSITTSMLLSLSLLRFYVFISAGELRKENFCVKVEMTCALMSLSLILFYPAWKLNIFRSTSKKKKCNVWKVTERV